MFQRLIVERCVGRLETIPLVMRLFHGMDEGNGARRSSNPVAMLGPSDADLARAIAREHYKFQCHLLFEENY